MKLLLAAEQRPVGSANANRLLLLLSTEAAEWLPAGSVSMLLLLAAVAE
jgi:hypothetical protein